MTHPDPGTWELIADGDLGEPLMWEPPFEPIESALLGLAALDEVGARQTPWKSLLEGMPYFTPLREMDFPPLHNPVDLEQLDGFLTFVDDPDDDEVEADDDGGDAPGTSFNRVRVYIEKQRAADLVQKFAELNARVRAILVSKGVELP